MIWTRSKPLALSACVLMGGLLAACGGAPKNQDALVSLTIGDWTGFDPAHCYDTACGEVLQNTLETLYFPKGESPSTFDPLLAQGMPTVSDGGRTYTVKLNTNAKFSDGTPVTAADVKYSLMRVMLMSAADGAAALLLEPLTGSADFIAKTDTGAYAKLDQAIQTPDQSTVVFHLAKPFAPFTGILAHPVSAVYSKAASAKAGEWDGSEGTWTQFNGADAANSKFLNAPPVGSAPFVLSRYDKASQVILKRNDKYWRDPAKLATVVIKKVDEPATAVQLLKTGDADQILVGAYPRNVLSQFKGLQGVTVRDNVPTLTLGVMLMNYNIKDPAKLGGGALSEKGIPANFFSDLNVRKAFAASFDYQGYIKDQLLGAGIQTNTVLIKGLQGYSNTLKYTFDKAAATAAFKKAWGGKVWTTGFTVPVYFNSGNANRQKAAELLKRSVESLNPKFHVDVREAQFSQILADGAAGRGSVWFAGWQADYADPHNFAQPLLASSGTYPQNISYKNPALDKLISQAVATEDPEARDDLYQQIEQIGFNDVAEIPLYQTIAYTVQRDSVKGRLNNPMFSGDYYYTTSKD